MGVSQYMEIYPFGTIHSPDKLRLRFKIKKNVETDSIMVRLVDSEGNVIAKDESWIDVSYIPVGDTGTIERLYNIRTEPSCPEGKGGKIADLQPGTYSFRGEDLHWYLIVVSGSTTNFVIRFKTSGYSKVVAPKDVDGDGIGSIGVIFRVSLYEEVEVELVEGQGGAVYDLGTTLSLTDVTLYMEVLEYPVSNEWRRATSTNIKCVTVVTYYSGGKAKKPFMDISIVSYSLYDTPLIDLSGDIYWLS